MGDGELHNFDGCGRRLTASHQYGYKVATWHPECKGGRLMEFGRCNTPVLTPFALNIHDTYIVNNHGAELKEKSPPSIWLCCVSNRNCHRWYIGTCGIHIKLWHHVTMLFKLNNPNHLVHYNQIEKGHDFLRLRGGLLNLDPMGKIHVSHLKPMFSCGS